jgi:neutral amino acid transport system ATP-binding protein
MVDPKMVMLDEPMAGVNPALTQSLLGHVKALPDHGMTVLFVEHDMDVVMDISDWVVVMGEGKIIAEGPPEAVSKDPAVIDAYLGQEHGDESRFTPNPLPDGPGGSLAVVEEAPPRLDDDPAGSQPVRDPEEGK